VVVARPRLAIGFSTASIACFWSRRGRTDKVQTGWTARPHIVVVEDETTQRRLLVDYLTRQNFRVSGADGGTALRKLVERDMPALVLLDVGLPGGESRCKNTWGAPEVPRLTPALPPLVRTSHA
jgi:DNA-binding NtrC family response regulator